MSLVRKEFAVVISDDKRAYTISIDDIFPSDLSNVVLIEGEKIENGYTVRAFLQSNDQIINGKIVYFAGENPVILPLFFVQLLTQPLFFSLLSCLCVSLRFSRKV